MDSISEPLATAGNRSAGGTCDHLRDHLSVGRQIAGVWIVLAILLAIGAVLVSTGKAQASEGQRASVVRYAKAYAAEQGWLFKDAVLKSGDYRRSYFKLEFLGNPAPGSEHCFDDVVYVDSCPEKFYEDDGPFYMDVEARVVRCGPGWYVVSTPLDRSTCQRSTAVLPKWEAVRRG